METNLRDYFNRVPKKGDKIVRCCLSTLEQHTIKKVAKNSLVLSRDYSNKPLRWYPYNKNFIILGEDNTDILQ